MIGSPSPKREVDLSSTTVKTDSFGITSVQHLARQSRESSFAGSENGRKVWKGKERTGGRAYKGRFYLDGVAWSFVCYCLSRGAADLAVTVSSNLPHETSNWIVGYNLAAAVVVRCVAGCEWPGSRSTAGLKMV